MTFEILTVPLEKLRINGGTQPRVELNEAAVADYAETIRMAGNLPPVTVYFDGIDFWLADGFHRYHAHRAAGAMEIEAEVREGTRRDAVLFSVGANASHGLRRTNEDKRRSVQTLLDDAEWAAWSDNQIAKACGVSNHLVADVKAALTWTSPSEKSADRTYTTKHGTPTTMNTASIGKTKNTHESATDSAPETGIVAGPAAHLPPAVETEPENFGPSAQEIADSEKAEADQLAYIKNLLDTEDDPLTKALTDVKKYRAEIEVLKWSRDGHQNKANELMRMVKSLQAKLKKLERAA